MSTVPQFTSTVPTELSQLPFVFLGGNLAIDLVNTRRSRRLSGSREIIQFDQLWNLSQIQDWWDEASAKYRLGPSSAYSWSAGDFETLISLRAELRAIFESVVKSRVDASTAAGEPVGGQSPIPEPITMNAILARGSFVLKAEDGGLTREYSSRSNGGGCLLTIALAAAELLAERDLGRLRHCRSERCTLLFFDGTKSGTRHWCRPECMNRARARENYRKAKGRN